MRTLEPIEKYYGEVIVDAAFSPDAEVGTYPAPGGFVMLRFPDGIVRLWDDGRACCEQRSLSTDDDLSLMRGERLVRVEVVDGDGVRERGEDAHERAFLRIVTDRLTYVVCAHNVHNGYYTGINLVATETEL